MVKNKKIISAIYCRVSTSEQNPKIQEEIARKYADNQNIEIYKIYTDIYSGTVAQRPQFNILIEDMRQFKFNTIIVTKLDRIGRSLKHLLSLFEEFKLKNIDFIAVQQNIDTTTSVGRLQLQILGAFAEFERNLISERTKDGLKVATGVGKRGKDKSPRNRSGYLARYKKKDNYFEGGLNK